VPESQGGAESQGSEIHESQRAMRAREPGGPESQEGQSARRARES
jgi:hypothetical protein